MKWDISKEQIKALAEKWMQGTLSEEERALFESWYNRQDEMSIQWPGNETEEQLQSRIYSRISAELKSGEKNGRLVVMNRWWRVAAAALILLSGVLTWYAVTSTSGTSEVTVTKQDLPVKETAGKSTDFIRHITLPDGTHVVLQANSRLDYPEKFTGSTREVFLSGQAYFDVSHDAQRAFIIHTGRVRTTVLGTAFNISAPPDGKIVVVSVTRGKVKVERGQKLLAVLTPNQQVTYMPVTAAVSKDTMNVNSLITNWTKHEMVFEGQSFEEVASLLGRRYGVHILFKTEGLKRCTIKAYFNGTETLEKVLDILCVISNAGYSMPDGKTVVLDGEGYDEKPLGSQ